MISTPVVLGIIIAFAVGVVVGTLVYRLCKARKRIRHLEESNQNLHKSEESLLSERSRQSDALRQKGIEIDKLKKELEKYSDTEIKVALTGQEKLMLLNALDMSQFRSKVQEPATKFFIRQTYREVKEKIKASIKE